MQDVGDQGRYGPNVTGPIDLGPGGGKGLQRECSSFTDYTIILDLVYPGSAVAPTGTALCTLVSAPMWTVRNRTEDAGRLPGILVAIDCDNSLTAQYTVQNKADAVVSTCHLSIQIHYSLHTNVCRFMVHELYHLPYDDSGRRYVSV
jgi:hypothetical protein